MNKIQAACIYQTIEFSQPAGLRMSRAMVLKANKEELAQFIKNLENLHVRYQITEQKELVDGSIVIKLRKHQDYVTPVTGYFKK